MRSDIARHSFTRLRVIQYTPSSHSSITSTSTSTNYTCITANMNCPSRNDDDELHPEWNQNPPRFAADLTTCEDLNGIANARELGNAGRMGGACPNLVRCALQESDADEKGKIRLNVGEGVKGSHQGTYRSR